MKTNQQEEMEKEFKHITETAMKGWSFSPFITEQLKPYTKDLFDKTYTLQQEKIEKLEKDNDLKDSWIKHHQKTVEIQLEKVAELNKQIEILRSENESYEIDMIEKTIRKAIESTEYMIQAYDKQVVNHGPKVKTKQDLQIDLEVLKSILNKLTMAA